MMQKLVIELSIPYTVTKVRYHGSDVFVFFFLCSELTHGSLIIWINSEGTDYFFGAGSHRPLRVPSGFRSFNHHRLQPCKAVRRAPDHI